MQVALIGAPGSGKSELADRLSTKYNLFKVDGYIPRLENRTGIVMGYLADLVPNLLCATERLSAEYECMQNKGEEYVICGTVIESSAYTAIRAVENFMHVEDKRGERMRIQAIMDTLVMMLEDWRYDYVFYLPLSQSHEDEWDKRLDQSIREALATLGIDHAPLMGENKFDDAVAVIDNGKESEIDAAPTSE